MNIRIGQRPRFLALITLVIAIVVLPMQSCFAEPTKRALLISIDDYKVVSDLNGTGNDVALMRSMLLGKFGFPESNIRTISDKDATRDAIIDAIRTHLIEPTESGDIVVLHYSGHGSQMPDVSGDEIDGFDETLVPYDARTPGVFDISDDELNALLAELSDKTDNVTVIFDSCNSGSVSRGAAARMIPPDDRTPPSDERNLAQSGESMRAFGANFVLISGARADELANETRFEGKTYGALTYYLTNALMSSGSKVVYRDVMDQVQSKVSARFPTQHPQLEGAGMDTVVFNDETIRTVPYVLVQPRGSGNVTIGAGEESGLTKDSELDIYAPGTKAFTEDEIVARVKITSTGASSARGRIISGGDIEANSRATLQGRAFGDFTLRVWLDDSVDRSSARKLRARFNDQDVVDLAEDASTAEVIVTRIDDQFVLKSADLAVLSPGVAAESDEFDEDVERQLLGWARWYSLLDIDNPNPSLSISLNVRREDDPEGTPAPQSATAGENIVYTVQNNSGTPLYLTSLVLSADGSVNLVYPARVGAQESLPAGETFDQELQPTVPDGQVSTTDVLKVIATDKPVNPTIFPQGSVRGSRGPSQELPDDPLERLLATASNGLSRNLAPAAVALNDWATAQVSITTRRKARAVSYAVHTDRRLPGTRSAGQRGVCDADAIAQGVDCIEATPLSADGGVLEVSPASTRGGPPDEISLSQAFEGAYELRDELGYDRVEPLFEVQAENNVDTVANTRSLLNDPPHDPRAAADDIWSVKYIRAEDAWDKIRARHNTDEGLEAAGVLIAHPDTGYRKHPEVWNTVNGQRAVKPEAGIDLKDNDTDPFDPLVDSGPLANPGHGLASGSVIVSPPGCQLQNSDNCVTGIAPGAQLVPIRVHTSVVVLNQRNLAKAIDAAADDELDVETPLVSIAMGGPPSWTLWRAVKNAEKNGKLIIAAAGNRVGTVVWPARFKSTIAVAAVNIGCKPWNGSSRGRAVDIAAPGESVWRAAVDKDSEEQLIAMGRGTTFATGTTAGAAALWIAYHQNEPAFDDLVRDGDVVRAFRNAVQQSAWRPDTAHDATDCDDDAIWNTRRYGAGIVNADALLDQSLSTGGTRSLLVTSEALPLIDSIYDGQADAAVIESDYRRLFGVALDSDLGEIAYFESEVAFHYSESRDVRDRFDAIVAGDNNDIAFSLLRETLLAQNLSPRLRAALTQ